MNHPPRFRLGTLFVLFFCAAVGLTTDRNPLSALQPAIATAMIIGLLQQINVLRRVQMAGRDGTEDFGFAQFFAIVWRALVAVVMALIVVTGLLGSKSFAFLPARKDLFFYEPFTVICDLCPIVVLASSVRRWQPVDLGSPPRRGKLLLFGLLAVLLTSFVVVDGSLTEYLTHRGLAGIEASITPRFQRPGVYPNHASEGFPSFWLASAAASSVVVGAVCLLVAIKCRASMTIRRLFVATFVACLLAQVLYCRWFYAVEFRRISPELAGVGLAANWADWLAATAIVLIMVTAGAYRLSMSQNERATVSSNLAEDLDRTAFYETVPCLVLMAIATGTTLITFSVELTSSLLYPMFPTMPSWLYPGMFCNPTVLLFLAQTVLAFQLCWIRWQRRGQEIPWEMPALPARMFAANWLALALAIVIGVPTLNAFGFLFWLGPFNFTGI